MRGLHSNYASRLLLATIVTIIVGLAQVSVVNAEEDENNDEVLVTLTFLADVTWYDPAICDEAPINCMGDPMRTAGGYYVPDWYDQGIACPSEFPMGTKITIEGLGELTCIDRGGSIVLTEDGVFRFDLLHHVWDDPLPRRTRVATAEFDSETLSRIMKRGDVGIPFVKEDYLFNCPALNCSRIYYTFGQTVQNVYTFEWYNHRGVDFFTGVSGLGSVYAAAPGVVSFSAHSGGCGGKVTIDHGDGWETVYCHLTEWYVEPGQWVSGRQILGKAGQSGYTIEGQHVHIELLRDDVLLDFTSYLYYVSGYQQITEDEFAQSLETSDIQMLDIYPGVLEGDDIKTDSTIEVVLEEDKAEDQPVVEEAQLEELDAPGPPLQSKQAHASVVDK